MSYDVQKQKFGKRAVQIVEIYMDSCSLTYGTSPCTAAVGTTGTGKCFNTFKTCQDRANFDKVTKKYRFSTERIDTLQVNGETPTFPTLMSVETAPTILSPGQGLGVRSSLSIMIEDHPWTDSGCDKYKSTRTVVPDNSGTFWGKFLARNKYYENRRIDVLTGFLNDDGSYDEANFKRRTYIISKVTGPAVDGTVKIDATDPLRLADGEKAKWPAASTATLTSSISNSTNPIVITDEGLQFSDWWAAGGRYFRIEDEIIHATAIAGTGTASVSLTVDRGTMPFIYNSTRNVAIGHSAGVSAQPCWYFDDMVYNIVYFLLNTVAKIDPSYLPLSEWAAAIDDGYSYLHFRRLLTEPADVKTMLIELSQLNVMIWWHERDSVVKLKPLRFTVLSDTVLNDTDNIVADSVAVTEDPKSLITQLWTYYDVSWPLADPTLDWEYTTDIRYAASKENDTEYGYPGIKIVRTPWLDRSDTGTMVDIASTTIRQYDEVRKVIGFTIDPKDDEFWVGDTITLQTRYIQDEFGQSTPKNYLITQATEDFTPQGYHLSFIALELFYYVRTGLITHPNGAGGDAIPAPPNYPLSSADEKKKWGYICYDPVGDNAPVFLDGTPAYQIV